MKLPGGKRGARAKDTRAEQGEKGRGKLRGLRWPEVRGQTGGRRLALLGCKGTVHVTLQIVGVLSSFSSHTGGFAALGLGGGVEQSNGRWGLTPSGGWLWYQKPNPRAQGGWRI